MVATDNIGVGSIFSDAKPPRKEWRIDSIDGNTIMLERIDKPSVIRFVNSDSLRDSNRYLQKQ
ncbi:MAG: hypothetical protein WD711_04555 [Dongiaceae bacterium]